MAEYRCQLVCILLITAYFQFTSISGVHEDVISHCCELGRAWAIQSQEICGPYPESYIVVMLYGPEETLMCTALVDTCCVQVRRDKQCSAGRETAVVLGRCDGLHLYQANEDAKECCNCCHLGIIMSQMSDECHVPVQLSLSLICAESFTECCLGRSPVLSGGETVVPVPPPTLNPQQPPRPTEAQVNANHLPPPGLTSSKNHPTTTVTPFIDVCEQFKGELCAHLCISSADSYHCECREGFSLQSDGKSCLLIATEEVEDERIKEELGLDGTDRQLPGALDERTSPTPITLPPGRCRHGYAWNRITYQCEDIDECILDLHNCDSTQLCVNIDGHFQCLEEELDDRDIYDDYYPETDLPPTTISSIIPTTTTSTITTTTSTTTSRPILRSRPREDRPIFRPIFTVRPSTQSPGLGRTVTSRSLTTTTEGVTRCLSGYAPDSKSNKCIDVDECLSGVHNCRLPNQLCINTVGSHRCQCERGYTMNPETNFCEDVDECVTSSACSADQICENNLGSYVCTCSVGFTMNTRTQQCTDINECRLTPNICGSGQECQNVLGSYRCTRRTLTCSHGYQPNPNGTQCIDVDECSVNGNICGMNRNCENTVGSYHCRCTAGYRLNASTAQCDDFDECQSREFSCVRGQVCMNTPGSYECRCEPGFSLDDRTSKCVDINECEQSTRVCGDDDICENTHGSFRCLQKAISCPTGFTPSTSGRQCVDVDECRLGTDNCGVTRSCYNTPGSFRCVLKQCPRGQRLDQETGQCIPVVCARGMRIDRAGTCVDINECAERRNLCRPHQVCHNTIGSFQCHNSIVCGSGYELNEDTGQCDDIDECQSGTHRCQGNLIQCINRPGTYLCQCPEGYHLDHQRQSCEDIDECRLYRGHICSQNADCQNSPGSYRCICKEGYELAEDKRSCRDVDECHQPRLCQHNCHNTWGSFRCSCNSGYQLSSVDSRSCSDIDECTVWSQRGTVLCQGICENTPGSYRCNCPPGYQMGTDGRVCRDVDECAGSNNGCSRPDDVCINTRGGHKCETVVCPKGFSKLTNSNRNSHAVRCQRKTFSCPQGDADCLYAPISYSVNFITVPGKLIRVPIDLFTMRGPIATNRRLQFELQVVRAQDPRTGAVRANRAFFNLNEVRSNEVVVQLIHEIHGAQDIQLQLNMNVYSRDLDDESEEIFFGTAVAKIFIYITEDPW